MNEESQNVDSVYSPNARLAINTKNENEKSLSTEKICKICGDRAVGFNFGIITCESCKAFFRRNACKENEIKCPFSNACEINKVSRRFCQSCRLQKCLKMGMKKEWLTSEKPQRLRSPSSHKHKLNPDSAETLTLDEIEKCGVVSSSDEVRVPKHMFEKLIKTAHQMQPIE
uniref:Nuclear receptor domain-containing protein n=1 Tax=Panagrolaimus sp. ES5 TaxID=591445 RepID=A0AC34F3P4_9BILA